MNKSEAIAFHKAHADVIESDLEEFGVVAPPELTGEDLIVWRVEQVRIIWGCNFDVMFDF
jgi:hypothetical protein